ncbi:hypothetical protein T4A_7605 [Trichinella pseudospiralis]|uniref:Uncharacterized protein n=1 Tax=Trichinella pseudospiralis TaxID=6337 RepID=A0A0V1DJE4_TRIPS|nr:hypothetical protein T4A_7605 [Trichinella pseudospiralis]
MSGPVLFSVNNCARVAPGTAHRHLCTILQENSVFTLPLLQQWTALYVISMPYAPENCVRVSSPLVKLSPNY